jgi:hypothetical protein
MSHVLNVLEAKMDWSYGSANLKNMSNSDLLHRHREFGNADYVVPEDSDKHDKEIKRMKAELGKRGIWNIDNWSFSISRGFAKSEKALRERHFMGSDP